MKILREKKKAGDIILLNFKMCYRMTVTETTQYWHKKQTHRPMEQNREPRNKTMHLQLSDLRQNCQKQAMGKGFPIQLMVLRQLASHMKMIKTGPLSYTVYMIN